MNTISWGDFKKIEIRVGTIVESEDFPEAIKPAYKLKVDLGESLGIKQSSAQITTLYSKEDLIGKQVIGVCNFPEKNIAGVKSQFLVLGALEEDGKVVLLHPSQPTKNGLKIT